MDRRATPMTSETPPLQRGRIEKGTVVNSKSSVAIFSYLGQDVRVVTIDGTLWWVAADVARVLGYRDAFNLTRRLDDDEKGTRSVSTPGGEQALGVINEPGLYAAILGSQVPNAREFKRWVTHVVLPTIRESGAYSAPAAREVPQTFAEALREFAAELEAHEVTKAALNAATPRAEAWDAIASAEGDYSVGEAAKILARAGIPNIGPQRLFTRLAELGWTFRGSDGQWMAYADRVDRGYLGHKPQFHYHPKSGERVIDPPQLRVTVKGLEALRKRLHVSELAVAR